ncbi:MAG: hypothetical protein ABJE47_11545 [bacterium]
MQLTRLARVALVPVAMLAIACGDPLGTKATYANALNTYAVYGLTNSPAVVPNALSFFGGLSRASSAFAFDIAFDVDASGKVVVYPVRAIGGAMAGTLKRVSLQTITGNFDLVTAVPVSGYDSVSAKTLAPGTVLAVELRDGTTCYASLKSSLLYAKLVVDSITAGNRIWIRTVIDPNCGYRGVVPDSIPTI